MVNAIRGQKGFQFVPEQERFWAKVAKSEGCWLWTGSSTNGTHPYGQFWRNGRQELAHRVALAFAGTEIPDDCEVDHLCRATLCVRVTHLDIVSHQENNLRGDHYTNNANRLKEVCKYGHPLTGDNLIIQGSHRRCRECRRLFDQKRRARTAIAKALGEQS